MGVGFALLILAWAFTTPPYGAPDEAQHFVRAASISRGWFLGPKAPVKASTTAQAAWLAPNTRAELVDARLVPAGWICLPMSHPTKGKCLVSNYVGNYEPLSYFLPAAAVRFANHATRGVWFGRLASVFQCLVFLILAFALLWRGTAWSLLGLFAALTPSTLFMTSVINPDGLELAANLAFMAGLLRLSRPDGDVPAWVWPAIAVSGAVVVLAWHLGWIFVSVELALMAILLGRSQVGDLIRSRRRQAGVTALVLSVAMGLFLAWGLIGGLFHGHLKVSLLAPGSTAALTSLRTNIYGVVALFGQLDVALPADGYYWVWWIFMIVLFLAAVALGKPRERVVVVLAAVVALLFTLTLYAWVLRPTGFGLEPRYVMPLAALIPLLAGEFLYRARDRLPGIVPRYLPSVAVVLVACYELMAWWINARASAGEPTVVWFLRSPHWNPPRGWIPWVIAAIGGTLVLIGFAISEALVERRAWLGAASNDPLPPRLFGSPSRT